MSEPSLKITNGGMLFWALFGLGFLAIFHAPVWAFGLWITIGATTVKPGHLL